ncbi:MAG: hypothetical protein ACYC1D_16085, partial [Acidimicrobiales bacterium]
MVKISPGRAGSRPTREVAWMYAAVFFGLSGHDHQPEPGDVHADLEHAGSQQHVERLEAALEPLGHRLPVDPALLAELLERRGDVEGGVEGSLQVGQGRPDPVARHPAGQLAHHRPATAGADGQAGQAIGDVVVHQAAHPGQLPGRREVVHHGHVRVGGITMSVKEVLGVLHDRRHHSDLDGHEPLTGGQVPTVQAPRGRRGWLDG